MIANNIFRAIGDFCTNFLFAPVDSVRFMESWWMKNTISWIFVTIGFIGFIYWMNELKKYKNTENQ